MLEVNGLKIFISRGDTGSVTVTFTGTDVPDDTVTALVILQKTDRSESIWEKRLPINSAQVVIPFRSIDTRERAHGEYRWILRLLYENGDVYTPMDEYEKFIILPAGGNIAGGDESG